MIVLILIAVVLVIALLLPSAETRGKMRMVDQIDEYIKAEDRKHAELEERRNRTAWGCLCGGLGCVDCQHFDL